MQQDALGSVAHSWAFPQLSRYRYSPVCVCICIYVWWNAHGSSPSCHGTATRLYVCMYGGMSPHLSRYHDLHARMHACMNVCAYVHATFPHLLVFVQGTYIAIRDTTYIRTYTLLLLLYIYIHTQTQTQTHTCVVNAKYSSLTF